MATMMSGSSSESGSEPLIPPDSPGSSVSSRMQEEYDELLKYAVVVPAFDPSALPQTLSDVHGSFNPLKTRRPLYSQQEEEQAEGDGTLTEEDVQDRGSVEEVTSPMDRPQSTPLERSQHVPPRQEQRQGGSKQAGHDSLEDRLAARLFYDDRPGSPESQVSSHIEGASPDMERDIVYTIGIDEDVSNMENMLDKWTYELKKNVLDEFGRSKIRLIEHHRTQMQKEKEKHAGEMNKMYSETDNLKELLHTYELSVTRKDDVISNLTRGLQKQKEKYGMLKTFMEWKIKHNDVKREAFATNLAKKHYDRSLQLKCWDAWHAVVENRWRQRVEKACQAKAQEVCMELTNDYETKINSLNEALESSRSEVARLHEERDRYEEMMKKAFMRGVCALNLEAMSMFNEADKQADEQGGTQSTEYGEGGGEDTEGGMPTYSTTIAQEGVYTSHPPGGPPQGRVVHVQAAHRGGGSHPQPLTSRTGSSKSKSMGRGKAISAKVTARGGSAMGSNSLGGSLAPPMSSVVVERHQPVVKATIGHATASKYPKTTSGPSNQPGILQRKIAGQSGNIPLATPNIQTVKVVD